MNIVVTGSNGFLGCHLMRKLQEQGYEPYGVRSTNYDLRCEQDVINLFEHVGKVDVLFHLAALVGGIGANRLHPGLFFYENMQIGVNVIHQAMLHKVGKVVMVGTTCSYPKFAPVPFCEHSLFDGYPEETNAPYGITKRALLVMLQAYQQEYGLRFAYLIPTNMFGPGDKFDDATSHVIPALIKKCLQARENNEPSVEVWGTGKASRDFVYVEDVAAALILAMERYDRPEPLNLGSGQEIRIDTLVYLIKQATGYEGKTMWDTSKPDGQPRRCLDTKAAKNALGWKATTDLQIGLAKTVEWYGYVNLSQT